MLESKRKVVEENLLMDAKSKIVFEMIKMGLDPQSDEAKEKLNPDNIKHYQR